MSKLICSEGNQFMSRIPFLNFLIGFLSCVSLLPQAFADEGHPIAIRRWSGDAISIETMWNLKIGIGLSDQKLPVGEMDFDVHSLDKGKGGVLFRDKNSDKSAFSEDRKLGKNDVLIKRGIILNIVDQGKVTLPVTEVTVDGVRTIIFDESPSRATMTTMLLLMLRKKFEKPNVIVAVGESFDKDSTFEIWKAFKPQLMVVNESIEKVGELNVRRVSHNTVAASSGESETQRIVSLSDKPYEMSDDLAELFEKKEAASRSSREFFAKMSVAQMNFKPSNGTHTPRWNTEHMMGRELGFFSNIYHEIDNAVPAMNLNPKQMPKDYEFAHPEWTGAEEARQTKRVEDFTRRFAYLLDGVNLGKRIKGSPFPSLRALLKQMERHYKEHTANVVKKMELDGWPKK